MSISPRISNIAIHFSITLFTFAGAKQASASEARHTFSKENFGVAVGAEYVSQLDRRGVITYGSFQAFPIFSIDLFHPDLQLVGATLNWKAKTGESVLYRFRLNADASNDSPLYETAEKLNDRVRRPSAGEAEAYLELNPFSWLEATFNYGIGFGGYSGSFGELSFRLKFGQFFERPRGHLLEPALFASIGGGTMGHNEYFYGAGATSGLSYSTVGISFVSPGIVDHFYPWLKIYRSNLISDSRNASYVRPDEREHWTFLVLAAKKVW
jgi:hypothetical protein